MASPQSSEIKYFTQSIHLAAAPTAPPFEARLAYQTHGDPSNPAILLPSCYGGKIASTSPFLYSGADAPFPTTKYFIIVTNLLSGTESSSPSNAPPPFSGASFPRVSYEDNLKLQHALCASLGVTHLLAYIGFSMGGQQAYHMGVLYPGFASHLVCIAGSARTSGHNFAMLEGAKAALVHSIDYMDGQYTQPASRGVEAFETVFYAWALSQRWFRERTWEKLGYASIQEHLRQDWLGSDEPWDARDLVWLLDTWQRGNVAAVHEEDGGSLEKALGRITDKVLLLPSRTDQYFPPEDNEDELRFLKHGRLVVLESAWGHVAGAGVAKEDAAFLQREIGKFVLGE